MRVGDALKVADVCQFLPTDMDDDTIDERVRQSCYDLVSRACGSIALEPQFEDKYLILKYWIQDVEECKKDSIEQTGIEMSEEAIQDFLLSLEEDD